MAEGSRARAALEEQLQKLQREADAERTAAQARQAQLQARVGKLQEVSHPLASSILVPPLTPSYLLDFAFNVLQQ